VSFEELWLGYISFRKDKKFRRTEEDQERFSLRERKKIDNIKTT
jgi:hypothetical protein